MAQLLVLMLLLVTLPSWGTVQQPPAEGDMEVTLSPTGDTFINIDSINYSGEPNLNLYTWPNNQIANAIILKFDTSGIPTNATVVTAQLTLVMEEADSAVATTYSSGAHKLLKPVVTSQATGNIYATGSNWTANACCFNSIPMAQSSSDIAPVETIVQLNRTLEDKTWSIPVMTQQWVQSPSTNYGVMINSDTASGADGYRTFKSQEHGDTADRPTLTITYNLPGGAQDPGNGTVKGNASGLVIKGGTGQTWR